MKCNTCKNEAVWMVETVCCSGDDRECICDGKQITETALPYCSLCYGYDVIYGWSYRNKHVYVTAIEDW